MKIRILTPISIIILGSVLISCGDSELPAEVVAFEDKLPETIDYNLHIKPILSD